MSAPPADLLQTTIGAERDIFVVRQRGREVAAAIGLEHQDQVRIATALSEVGRQVLTHLGPATVTFRASTRPPMLCMDVAVPAAAAHSDRWSLMELDFARRLMDLWRIESRGEERVVLMGRALPSSAPLLTPERIEQLRDQLRALSPATPLDELAMQNRQLLAALEEVQAQRDELLHLNAELTETNRGVMALYGQLSQELEQTNKGVVALYAELDERSAQLREANEAKSRFLANVSHELRAPVTAVIGLARLLNDPASEPLTEEQRRPVDLILSSATGLLSLVNDLLDLVKAESGRLEPQWETVDLVELFGSLRATMRVLEPKPDVELHVDEPTGVPSLCSDQSMIMQVLRNLLTNGLKFTTAGEVRLTARVLDADSVALAVSDTGIGIPAELQGRIFEEFYQVPGAARATGIRGTGLGLPYARRLVALLGGRLDVRSQPGAGSTFTVTLPVEPGRPLLGAGGEP
jgi:signal transduction histidine kinase